MKKKAMLAAMAACLLSGNLAAYAPLNVLATDIKTTQDGFEAADVPFVTWANTMASAKASSWGDVRGFYSVNNNNKGVDFKITKKQFNTITSSIGYAKDRDTYFNEVPDRTMGGLSATKSYLIEHNFLQRRVALSYGRRGIEATLDGSGEDFDLINRMDKTELYTMLYKILYGTVESRTIIWRTDAFRNVDGSMQRVSSQKNYKTTDGQAVHAIFDSDYNVYAHPDVYELYLSELLNKGLIEQGEISTAKSSFLTEYNLMQRSDYKPPWHPSQRPVIISGDEPVEGTNYLGSSVSLNRLDGSSVFDADVEQSPAGKSRTIIMESEQPDYFRQENLTTIDALKIIETMLRGTEKDMTKTEANTVAYKYGTRYLGSLDSSAKGTVAFLIAKGILNFEDDSEYIDLYQDFTYETAYKLLYRVANKDARYDFSKIQLTDNEVFWQEQGFAEDRVSFVDGSDLPYMKILEDSESFASYDDRVKKSATVAKVEGDGAEEPPSESETETETVWEQDSLLYVQCIDNDTNQPISNATISVYAEDGTAVGESVTDQQGVVTFQLREGTYYFEQTDVPDDYVLNDYYNSVSFSQDGEIRKFRIRNSPAEKGNLTVSVHEEDAGVPVPGAYVEVYDSEGEIAESFFYGESVHKSTLPYGVYTVKVSSVPEGYENPEPALTKTIKLSKYNRNASADFTIALKSTIVGNAAQFINNLFADTAVYAANKKAYVIKLLLEDKDGYSYSYGSTSINATTKKSDNDDLAADVATKVYAGSRMYQVTFKIEAASRDDALSIVQSKLRVSGVTEQSSVIGVTEIEGSDGVKSTMVSADDVRSGMADVKVINNNTLMNVKTGATAMILPEQGYALVGNKIIKSDNLVAVTDSNKVYYNLEIICAILSNASIKKINGATSLVSKSIKKEKLFDVYSENGTKLESNYAATFDSVVYEEKNEGGTIRKKPLMYNMDSMSRGLSCLTRTFKKRVNIGAEKNASSDVTIIVKWNFIVPNIDSLEVQGIKSTAQSGTITFQDAADILNTEPKDSVLREWWNYNLDMSNALANFMYGTKGTQYVTCGYLVPSVTVLSSAGGNRKGSVSISGDNQGVSCSLKSLSDSQLNKLFKELSLSPSYLKKYLGSTKSNWWESYYNVSKYDSSFIKSLMSKASFRNLAGSEVYYGQDASQATTDGHVFGNAEYLILNNGTVYANAETNTDFTLDKNGHRITVRNFSTGGVEMVVGKGTQVVVNSGGQEATFEYCSTEAIGEGIYHKMRLVATDGSMPVYFSGYLDSKGCKSVEQLQKAAENPENYKTQLGMSLYDYEKNLYKFLGMQGVPVANMNVSKRFALNKDSLGNGILGSIYADFYNDGVSGVRFCRYGDKSLTDVATQDLAVMENGSCLIKSLISANVYVYVPTNNYYFAKDSTGAVKLFAGSDVGVLNTRIYYTGLNNSLRDSILAESAGTVPVNQIASGSKVYVGGILFTKMQDGSLVAGPVKSQNSLILGILSAIDSNNEESLKSCLLQTFGAQCVIVGTRNVSLQSFITDIAVGSQNGVQEKKTLFREKSGYQYVVSAKKCKDYQKGSVPNLINYNLSIRVDDALLCRPIDSQGLLYQMLYCSDAYVSGLGNLPFYPEYLGEDRNSTLNVYWEKTAYTIHQYVNSMKDSFLEDYRKAWEGDFISMCKMIVASILLYLMIISWICLFFLKFGVGRRFFEALAMPTGISRNGIDLFKILSLGLFHYDDIPSVSRVALMNFVFYGIMFIILDIL